MVGQEKEKKISGPVVFICNN